ncbi:MAG TPA: polysaccharide deacetylase family protein [Desulfobacteria bacterium]|nr:polysaccharide deacetylase family protein [Desulfobacteria bacterium]
MKKYGILCLYIILLTLSLSGCSQNQVQTGKPQAVATVPARGATTASTAITTSEQVKVETPKWHPVNGNNPLPANGVPILTYHTIAALSGTDLGVPPTMFAEQMQYLHDAGYTTISLEQLYAAYHGESNLPPKPVVLTFDDGYPDNYQIAFPILKKYNFTAAFFIYTAGADNGDMMTWQQLKEMSTYGMDIEPHTVSHADLNQLSASGQRRELADSKAEIEHKLGTSANFFDYPKGQFDAVTLRLLPELGYQLAVTSNPGRAKRGDNIFALRRIYIGGDLTLNAFKTKINPE